MAKDTWPDDAGLEDLEPARFPSERVRHGPQRLPLFKGPTFLSFEVSQGGPHVLGARLIWWCAASADPRSFGYGEATALRLLIGIPWIEPCFRGVKIANEFLDTMQGCAEYVCDLLVSEARRVSSEAETSDVRKPAGPAADPRTPVVGSSGPLGSATVFPPHERWAIGAFTPKRWHLYERRGSDYRCLREIQFKDRPQSALLLEESFRGKGTMGFMEAYVAIEKLRSDPDRGERLAHIGIDETKVRKRVKPAVSHLRSQLFDNMQTARFNIIKYETGSGRFRLLVPIGASDRRLEGRRSGEYAFIPY